MKKIISVLLILLLFQSTNLNVKAQEERFLGDLHQDSIIDIKDLIILKAKILNKYTLENENFIFADIDENKNTDLFDFFIMKNHFLNLTQSINLGKPINIENTYINNNWVHDGKPLHSSIKIDKVDNLSDDFIRGVDVSSIISLEKSGVVFYNYNGDKTDIFKTLAESGVNYIRVRVWNNPYDENNNGYGGGNCDINTAIEIGKRATKYNLPLLVDFHYSDFWTDPSKQKAPKEWAYMSIWQKQNAIYNYTKDSLQKLLNENIKIGMVQLGNETVSGMSGENSWNNISVLMKSASSAIREIDRNILISVHFTNPEKQGAYDYFAQTLKTNNVDYDVFSSSYYPYWHGTPNNLTNVLTEISNKYNKKVMVAETSYAYTNDNGDFHPNVISNSSYGISYPLSVQGQATSIRDVIAAVSAVGDNGIGVFYWEPAWIPVPAQDYNSQLSLWERFGSGWASSYSSSYEPDDAGKYYGGSSWDNQALFDFRGHPLDSLKVFGYVYTSSYISK